MAAGSVDREQDSERGERLYDVVHDVLNKVAPDEVPLLAGMRELDDAQIGRRLAGRAKHEDPLGFGTGEIVVLAAPVIWGAVQHVADKVAASAADSLLARIGMLVRRMLRRRATTAPRLSTFTEDQLQAVRRAVLEDAKRAGMKKVRAEQVAACVVDRLRYPGPDRA